MNLNYKLAISLIVSCLVVPLTAKADKFDDAVNEYIKGYKACTEANTLRAQNLQAAKRKFNTYLQQLNKAKSIDPSILSTTQRDMDSNLRYCERVEVNIKRAEATPILEKGFTYCDNAKAALKNGDASSAKTNMDEYKRYRDDAMIITESIMDVFALASKVRSCARVEEKLNVAMVEENAIIEQLNVAIAGYQTVNTQCQAAKAAITSPKFTLQKLDDVNKQMNAANKAKKDARKNAQAFETLKTQPNRPQSQELQKLIDSAAQCEGETSEHIRTATKNKRGLEKQINAGIATLTESQQACEAAKSSSNRFTADSDISKAEADFKRSAYLKRRVTGDKNLIATVKKYPSWSSSQQFSKMMNSTEACQKSTAASIKNQKANFTAQKKKAQEDAARKAKLEEERQRLAEENARKEAEAAKQAEEKKRQEATARKQAEEEARRAAALTDVDDAEDVEDDEFGDFGEEDDNTGKSWTDLVR